MHGSLMVTVLSLFEELWITTLQCALVQSVVPSKDLLPLRCIKYGYLQCWYIPIECLGKWGGEALTWYTKLPYATESRVKGLMINILVFLAHYQNKSSRQCRWQQQFLFEFLTFEKLATSNISSLQQVLEMSIGIYNESNNVCEKKFLCLPVTLQYHLTYYQPKALTFPPV